MLLLPHQICQLLLHKKSGHFSSASSPPVLRYKKIWDTACLLEMMMGKRQLISAECVIITEETFSINMHLEMYLHLLFAFVCCLLDIYIAEILLRPTGFYTTKF